MTWPFTIERSRSALLSASKNATPKPTNGSVGELIPPSIVASANVPPPSLRNRLVRLELVIRDDQVEPAVPVVVAELRPHAGSRLAVPRHGHTRKQADFAEAPSSLVVEQEIRHAVVGHEHIRPAIVVVVADGNTKTIADVLREPGFRADVR